MKYTIKALERFGVCTTYEVEADIEEDAIEMCQSGEVPYISHEFTEDDEWIETISVEQEGEVQVCPSCGNECSDDVTLDDHNVCYDCHKEILGGLRCSACYDIGHTLEGCDIGRL